MELHAFNTFQIQWLYRHTRPPKARLCKNYTTREVQKKILRSERLLILLSPSTFLRNRRSFTRGA